MKSSTSILLLLLATTLGCGGSEGPPVDRETEGYRTYVNLRCLRCHGPDLAGTHKAPTLAGLAERWEREELIAFLRDPRSHEARDPRLRALAKKYQAHEMPPYDIVDTTMDVLVDFLLAPGS